MNEIELKQAIKEQTGIEVKAVAYEGLKAFENDEERQRFIKESNQITEYTVRFGGGFTLIEDPRNEHQRTDK